jgi:hypothetical protein
MIFRIGTKGAAMSAVVLSAAFLAGCATVGKPENPDEAAVKVRATARWEALAKGDFQAAYQFLPSSYRATSTLDDYRNRFGNAVVWLGAEPVSADCASERCMVMMNVEARMLTRGRAGHEFKSGVEETWVKEDGQWWYVMPR